MVAGGAVSWSRLVALTGLLLVQACAGQEDPLYAGVQPALYLTGQFNPETNEYFAPVTAFGVEFDNTYVGYIRNETGQALATMIAAFNAEYPDIDLPVVSATRNFTSQNSIWRSKWFTTYSDIPGAVDRALAILEYSSMPGTSRHHWGSDVDLYALDDIYFEYGDGQIIYDWLTEHGGDYGFCQPYTAGRCAGYNEEKWHWSYMPLSEPMLTDWWNIFGWDICNFLDNVHFVGIEQAGFMAPAYVSTVNQQCKA
mmetsp:Transcript_14798/g.58042  ORF Transcript_14798/g.58042 Transcript_14798/m.58042 type:complete len:254 (+) Transcript_14798:2-763(+)